jgi:hypothetical protein
MVCLRMGLLDDAIREHLELKRRRGADPGEVAREQREALDVAVEEKRSDLQTEISDEVHPAAMQDPVRAAPTDLSTDATGGEAAQPPLDETAELDMSSVLGAEESAVATPATSGEQDSLEWEIPGEAAEEVVNEEDDDVLEETPEFLRETPEEDRLWFEQRPPRDFDFDK